MTRTRSSDWAVTIPLATRVRGEFATGDWSRGSSYFSSRRATITERDDESLKAIVRGSVGNRYQVLLDWSLIDSDGRLLVECSCPRFADCNLCKHLAAVILEADRQQITSNLGGPRSVEVMPTQEFAESYWELDEPDYELVSDEDDEETGGDDFLSSGLLQFLDQTGRLLKGQRPDRGSSSRSQEAERPKWQTVIDAIRRSAAARPEIERDRREHREAAQRILYTVDLKVSRDRGAIVLVFQSQKQKKNGDFGQIRPYYLDRSSIAKLPDPEDRRLLGRMTGGILESRYGNGYGYSYSVYDKSNRCQPHPETYDICIPELAKTGRFGWQEDTASSGCEWKPLGWDDGPAYRFGLTMAREADGVEWTVNGCFVRGEERLPLSASAMVFQNGLVLFHDRLARLAPVDDAGMQWLAALRKTEFKVPAKQQDEFVEAVLKTNSPLAADLPEELQWQTDQGTPQPRMVIRQPDARVSSLGTLVGDVIFEYGEQEVRLGDQSAIMADVDSRRMVRRDFPREAELLSALEPAGFSTRRWHLSDESALEILPQLLPKAIDQLLAGGWKVQAEGKWIRQSGSFEVQVTSGVDWFDLAVACEFDGVRAGLPELLAAVERGQNYVDLGDGSRGMLPADWLEKYGPLAKFGRVEGEALRFLPSQAMILDALLSAQPQVQLDEKFLKVRDKLRSFAGVQPAQEPKTFQGELRPYQREGLGWLRFLQDFQFGGCLADDMGLGKTVQVLAQLESRRGRRLKGETRAPSLVVAPKSLVFNWMLEAKKFAPKLKVLNYTGVLRGEEFPRLSEFDLVVTTYGTLRRDIVKLQEVQFDYAILDESQAVKNSQTAASKACRLIQSRHRLAMTGTPVENHLGELWALFEFLNPGMLGRSDSLRAFSGKGTHDRESIELLAKALRPFLLRRTKTQVLSDLPEKNEQTLFCDLEPRQRKLYDQLRTHYQAALGQRIKKIGLKRSKIQVLEALLRLRQAACHPGLLDDKHKKHSCAKFDALFEQLPEVLEEGHKALVFSQFTSLLALARQELDARGIVYEYLDGKTRDRQARVERFQTDPACPLFLISLKAGGLGLNLTAADYVYILDPWWNPAVEAQAVDRTHRLGQTRPVFAYRLIARDTVEEKILQLQGQKRELAEAIISADEGLLRSLTAEDLTLLLS